MIAIGKSGGQLVRGGRDRIGIGGPAHRGREPVERADGRLRRIQRQPLGGAPRLGEEEEALLDLGGSHDPSTLHADSILLRGELDGGGDALHDRREFRLGDGRLPRLLEAGEEEERSGLR